MNVCWKQGVLGPLGKGFLGVYTRGLPSPEVVYCYQRKRVNLRHKAFRNIATNCGNHFSSDTFSEGVQVIKSWSTSLTSNVRRTEEAIPKETKLKRPPPSATFPKVDGNVTPKFRRKMTDNSWTTDPMDDKIIWVDCEMTGLDPSNDQLIEIGAIITDADLNEIATHESIVFHAEDSVLNAMAPWCIKHHGDSGLIEECKNSKITHTTADDGLLEFLQKYTKPGECPMAGNSIGQDRGFIRRQLPKFHSHFHYRDIDVSSIKELTRRWFPDAFAAAPRKKMSHRVLDDIRDSIQELKYYRSTVFIKRTKADVKNAGTAKN